MNSPERRPRCQVATITRRPSPSRPGSAARFAIKRSTPERASTRSVPCGSRRRQGRGNRLWSSPTRLGSGASSRSSCVRSCWKSPRRSLATAPVRRAVSASVARRARSRSPTNWPVSTGTCQWTRILTSVVDPNRDEPKARPLAMSAGSGMHAWRSGASKGIRNLKRRPGTGTPRVPRISVPPDGGGCPVRRPASLRAAPGTGRSMPAGRPGDTPDTQAAGAIPGPATHPPPATPSRRPGPGGVTVGGLPGPRGAARPLVRTGVPAESVRRDGGDLGGRVGNPETWSNPDRRVV